MGDVETREIRTQLCFQGNVPFLDMLSETDKVIEKLKSYDVQASLNIET